MIFSGLSIYPQMHMSAQTHVYQVHSIKIINELKEIRKTHWMKN